MLLRRDWFLNRIQRVRAPIISCQSKKLLNWLLALPVAMKIIITLRAAFIFTCRIFANGTL
ncbi:hypothetical protein [Nitrosomonas eutropha]|uniref:hypothetical protein n=1 Tax=Nitrosomonas eutropha TaxID=916 RepID=UPI0009423693|nr:hypothetical protein [Nitrosomonas eutropha]MXS80807.1 hypothetical protein [Nitrosomonas sp. GH22]